MYEVRITETGDNPEALQRYLVAELGLGASETAAIVAGDRRRVTTVDTRSAAETIAEDLGELGADTTIEPVGETRVVTGPVTFEGDRPDAAVAVEAVDVRGDDERDLGRTGLGPGDIYTVEYEVPPDRQVDLVARVVADGSTLVASEPVVDATADELVPLAVPAQEPAVSPDENDLFQFVMVRPADPGAADATRVEELVGETPLVGRLSAARSDGGRERMVDTALEYMASEEFAAGLEEASESLAALDERLAATRSPTVDDVRRLVGETFGGSPSAVVDSGEFRRAAERLADGAVALSVTPGADRDVRSELVRGLKLVDLVESIAAEGSHVEDVERRLDRPVALPDALFPLPGPATTETERGSGTEEGTRDALELHDRLEAVRAAREELDAARRTGVHGTGEFGADDPVQEAPGDDSPETARDGGVLAVRRPEGTVPTLSRETLDVLGDLSVGNRPMSLDEAADRLRREETELGTEFLQETLGPASTESVRVGDKFYPASTLAGDLDWTAGELDGLAAAREADELPAGVFVGDDWRPDYDLFDTELVNVLGVGTMKTVKRETAGYEMGDLAHVENVLQGEDKERVHEREEVTKETLITERETTETQERDLQTSDRFEMERESRKTVETKSSIEAGVKVSASYGPTVEVVAYTDYARSQSRERSERTARRYSREVTRETVNRIQRRTLRREVQKTIERVTETNTHGLDNVDGSDHVSGIYRWVDRLSRAQVFEHGRRLMLEFVVPEPAAFYRLAKASDPADQVAMEKPEPPQITYVAETDSGREEKQRPLRPSDLDNGNYQFYAERYGATDVSPPPRSVARKTAKIKQQGKGPTNDKGAAKPFYSATDVSIPDGYESRSATVAFSDVVRNKLDWRWKLQTTVGDHSRSVGWRGTWSVAPPGYDHGESLSAAEKTYEEELDMQDDQRPVSLDFWGETLQEMSVPHVTGGKNQSLPVTVFAYNLLGFGVTVTVECVLTPEHYDQWQIDTYGKIRSAYENELSTYREKLAEARAEEGIQIGGNAPEENRRIEREELKRLAISMLREKHVDVDAITDVDPGEREIPGVAFEPMKSADETIQFFEQAFEWTNTTYVFYPYFWTRRSKWAELQQYEADDPAFESFLSAGAARLIVPARPGFFDNVLWFLLTGEVTFERPDLTDEEHVPIVTEIKEQQGLDEDAEAQGDPWPVRVPTELVKLQQSQDLPDLDAEYPGGG